jgi:predicted ATPase
VTFGEINVPDQKPPYLKEFHAHSVWGKYEFHVEFKDGVNFISGLNGSSKSTLLYLIYSSLNNAQPLPFLDLFASKGCLRNKLTS